jgi:hypothetical protein
METKFLLSSSQQPPTESCPQSVESILILFFHLPYVVEVAFSLQIVQLTFFIHSHLFRVC